MLAIAEEGDERERESMRRLVCMAQLCSFGVSDSRGGG